MSYNQLSQTTAMVTSPKWWTVPWKGELKQTLSTTSCLLSSYFSPQQYQWKENSLHLANRSLEPPKTLNEFWQVCFYLNSHTILPDPPAPSSGAGPVLLSAEDLHNKYFRWGFSFSTNFHRTFITLNTQDSLLHITNSKGICVFSNEDVRY